MAKLPKTTKRYCPFCKKVTEQKIKEVSSGAKRGTLKKGSIARARLRGSARGKGNKGKYSKPKGKWKRHTKTTKKPQIIYTCKECGKAKHRKKGKRTGKLQIE